MGTVVGEVVGSTLVGKTVGITVGTDVTTVVGVFVVGRKVVDGILVVGRSVVDGTLVVGKSVVDGTLVGVCAVSVGSSVVGRSNVGKAVVVSGDGAGVFPGLTIVGDTVPPGNGTGVPPGLVVVVVVGRAVCGEEGVGFCVGDPSIISADGTGVARKPDLVGDAVGSDEVSSGGSSDSPFPLQKLFRSSRTIKPIVMVNGKMITKNITKHQKIHLLSGEFFFRSLSSSSALL